MQSLSENLRQSLLFNHLTVQEIDSLLAHIPYQMASYKKGAIIFDSYQHARTVGIVLSGEIVIERLLPSGKTVLMYCKKTGDIFGEVAAFSDAPEYPCNAIAKKMVQLLLLESDQFFVMLTKNEKLLKKFLNLVCNKAYFLNEHIGELSYTSAKQRVSQFLLNYAFKHNSSVITLPFSRQVLADRLNISRASLYRELESLCESHHISVDSTGNITILDKTKLQSITWK